jgi:hypothetical protein
VSAGRCAVGDQELRGVCFGGGGVLLRRFPGRLGYCQNRQKQGPPARATYAGFPEIWPITVRPNTSYHLPGTSLHLLSF